MKHHALCIIPARSGSKRIPGKNIRHFRGRPILSYAVRAALESGCFGEVMVSTESEEIAEVARAEGAMVPFFRSAEASNDTATTADVIREVLLAYQKLGVKFTSVCCLYPTAVLLRSDRLREGKALLDGASGVETVFPVHPFEHHIERAFRIVDGKLEMIDEQHALTRGQDLPTSYYDAGQFYWLKTGPFLKNGKVFSAASLPVVLLALECQDINTEEDWSLAELKWDLRQRNML